MPSLSVHQQKARKKSSRQQQRTHTHTHTHPAALAAQQWLAAHSTAAPASSTTADSLLSHALLSPSYIESARLSYSTARPFPHLTIRPLLDDTYCRHLLQVCKLLTFTHRRSGQKDNIPTASALCAEETARHTLVDCSTDCSTDCD